MFVPIGFFAAAGEFDPSLGGSLSTLYWWDFTDSSTMTLTGTDIDDITDKYSSYVLYDKSDVGAVVTFNAGGYAHFTGGTTTSGIGTTGTNVIPAGMTSNDSYTVICFYRGYSDEGAVWEMYTNTQRGYRNFGPKLGIGSTPPASMNNQLCTSHGTYGTIRNGLFETAARHQTIYTPMTQAQYEGQQMVTTKFDATGAGTFYHGWNNVDYDDSFCSRAWLADASTSGQGFSIGNGDSNSATMDVWHLVVYDQLLTDAEKDAVWDAYYASQS